MSAALLDESQCELGEGPHYCERRNTLFWFDIVGRARHALDLSSGEKTVLNLPEMASAMAVIDDETDAIFTESGLWKLALGSGAWTPLMNIEDENEITRSNDARVHPSGAFWIGTMGKKAEHEAGAIYHFFKGELTKLFDAITIPNAISFSPDAKTAYFTDTVTAKLMAVDVDPENGKPVSEPRVLIDHENQQGGLDGAIIDADGNIWVALWGASCVNCYASDGTLKSTFDVGAGQPSCPAFIDAGRIAVTTAYQGMSAEEKQRDPQAGMTFVIDANANPKYEPRVRIY